MSATLTTDPRGRIFVEAAAYGDPASWQATAAELRREQPVLRVEAEGFQPFWAVTKHADVMEISRQHERFPNTSNSVLVPILAREQMEASGMSLKTLINM